ncbi:MAG: arylsulfatase, partial [Chitinophagia bacterium]|nr:arylsulfatase [Chitinophagia bacterium]
MRITIKTLLFLLISVTGIAQQKSSTPNIVLIFMDDMGYGDLSCYGALDINTPNIDQLASEGIRFTNFLSSQAVCSASRASIMTGCYANRVGISGALFPGSKVGLASNEMTMAELLKQKNYATAIYGKWHLGDAKQFLPLQQGFDEYLGIPYSNDMWPVNYDGTPADSTSSKSKLPQLPLIKNNDKWLEIKTLEDQSTLTERYTTAAEAFIKKNKNKPFFLYLPHSMPHVPINASPAFRGKSKQGLYGDVIQEIDASVGRILKTIKENGLDNNTLVIFTSDNGPWINYGNHAGSTGGLREGKGTSFEGGQRVPGIIRWKGTIQPNIVSNQLASTIDLFPTIAAITKASLPNKKIDGVSILPILQGDKNATPRKTFLYYYRKNSLEAVRIDNWKLVFAHPSRSYLNQLPGMNGYPGKAPEDVAMPLA